MALGRPTKPLNVSAAEEKEKLTLLARRPKSSQATAMRAPIVLGCDDGLSNSAVARKPSITGATVCKNGASVFESTGWKGCSMSRARALRALDQRCQGRGGDHADAGIDAHQLHALEHAADGAEDWAVADCDCAHLARL